MGIRVMDSNDQERERGITILAKVGFASSVLSFDTYHGYANGETVSFFPCHPFFRSWFHLCAHLNGRATFYLVGIQCVPGTATRPRHCTPAETHGVLPAGLFGFALEGTPCN